MSETITGHCNCGSITVTIPKADSMVLCHCTSCRRSGGSLTSSNLVTNPKDMKLTGPSPGKYVAKGSSGNDTERYFCSDCGSPLWTAVADPNIVFVKGGLFDPGCVPRPATHLFGKNMEDWEIVHEGAERMEEQ
ncbi:hypothetical protein IAU60_000022 [Kwoniella sp. DSM 27419]